MYFVASMVEPPPTASQHVDAFLFAERRAGPHGIDAGIRLDAGKLEEGEPRRLDLGRHRVVISRTF